MARRSAGERRIADLTGRTEADFALLRDRTADRLAQMDAAARVVDAWSTGFVPGSSGARHRLREALVARSLEEHVPPAQVRAVAKRDALFIVAAAASSSSPADELLRAARREYMTDFGISLYGATPSIESLFRSAPGDCAGCADLPAPDPAPPIPPIEWAPSWSVIQPILTARQTEMIAAMYETLDSAQASELVGITHENGRRVRKDAEDRLLRAGLTDPRSDLHGGRYLLSEGTTVPSTQT